jgi:uncharacterized protein
MLKRKIYLAVAIIGFSICHIHAQHDEIQLLASPRQDSILLRWAPVNSNTWRLGNEYGYQIKRYTLLQGKKIPKEIPEIVLNSQPLKPAGIETWEKFADDKYMSIAAECIFGSTFKDVPTGASPSIAYKKYKEEKHRFSFALYAADQSILAATLSGLYFADKTAKSNEKYLYRVYINCPDSLAVDTAYSFTGLSEYKPLPKPLELEAEWSDKVVNLSWNIQYLNHIYNSYILEKSEDGGKNYQKTSENATVQLADNGVSPQYMFKTDSLPDNKSTFYYRVRGISAFGETGPASDSVFGKGMLPITTAPVIVNYELINNEKIKLHWEYPDEMNEYISGFKIYRSSKPNSRKKLIYNGNKPEIREYTDNTPNFTNYYLISVYNQQKEKLSPIKTYAERVDSFPPAPPQNFTGKIDSTGKVWLRWDANIEEDISGYRIYRANNPKFEFMLISPAVISNTNFIDSINLKTLTKKIYYKVKAIDARQNQSAFSNLLSLSRPDIIPPVSPVLQNIADKNGKPEITWINSSSVDVASHHIYRKEKTDSLFNVIFSIPMEPNSETSYLDKLVEPGKEYVYYITAEDDSKLQSPPSKTGYFKVASDIIESIKLKKRTYTDRVKLSWNIKSEKLVERILVYRSVDNGDMHLYGNSIEDNFIDNKLSPEKTYSYYIKVIYTDGTSSALSNSVSIKM